MNSKYKVYNIDQDNNYVYIHIENLNKFNTERFGDPIFDIEINLLISKEINVSIDNIEIISDELYSTGHPDIWETDLKIKFKINS